MSSRNGIGNKRQKPSGKQRAFKNKDLFEESARYRNQRPNRSSIVILDEFMRFTFFSRPAHSSRLFLKKCSLENKVEEIALGNHGMPTVAFSTLEPY